jgi:hypothetical protein
MRQSKCSTPRRHTDYFALCTINAPFASGKNIVLYYAACCLLTHMACSTMTVDQVASTGCLQNITCMLTPVPCPPRSTWHHNAAWKQNAFNQRGRTMPKRRPTLSPKSRVNTYLHCWQRHSGLSTCSEGCTALRHVRGAGPHVSWMWRSGCLRPPFAASPTLHYNTHTHCSSRHRINLVRKSDVSGSYDSRRAAASWGTNYLLNARHHHHTRHHH